MKYILPILALVIVVFGVAMAQVEHKRKDPPALGLGTKSLPAITKEGIEKDLAGLTVDVEGKAWGFAFVNNTAEYTKVEILEIIPRVTHHGPDRSTLAFAVKVNVKAHLC